jgi:uncharacterized membrane protein
MLAACQKLWIKLGLAALIAAGAAATAAVPAHAAEPYELYTTYVNLSAPPGETITYSVQVINRSDTTRVFPISLETNANNWEYKITAGGRQINEIAVKPDSYESINVQIDVPLEVNKGTYRFAVVAGDLARLPLVINVTEQGTYASEWTAEQANMEGHADDTFIFSTELHNRTAEEQTYALAAAVQPGWDARFSVSGDSVRSVTVEPNAKKTISVQIYPPQSIEAGTYQIPIAATNNATQAETTLEVVITGTYALDLTTADDRLNAKVKAGGSRVIDLVVKNTGTAKLEDVSLTSSSPVDWEVTFEPSKITSIEPGQTATVQATIKSSEKALAGDYEVDITARSAQKSDTIALRVAVQSSTLWGWIGILIVIAVAGGVYYLYRKYGRR